MKEATRSIRLRFCNLTVTDECLQAPVVRQIFFDILLITFQFDLWLRFRQIWLILSILLCTNRILRYTISLNCNAFREVHAFKCRFEFTSVVKACSIKMKLLLDLIFLSDVIISLRSIFYFCVSCLSNWNLVILVAVK